MSARPGRRLPRTAVVVLLACLALATLTQLARAETVTRHASAVSIGFHDANDARYGFTGRVTSGRQTCASHRRVVLLWSKVSKLGPYSVVAGTRTGGLGRWHIRPPRAGGWWKAKIAHTTRCTGDASRRIAPLSL